MSPPLYTVMDRARSRRPVNLPKKRARRNEGQKPRTISTCLSNADQSEPKADAEALISERIARRCGASARGRSHTRSVHDKESDGR